MDYSPTVPNVSAKERSAANHLTRATEVMRGLLGRPEGNQKTPENLRLLSKGTIRNAQEADIPPGFIVMDADNIHGTFESDDGVVRIERVGKGAAGQIFRSDKAVFKRVEGLYANVYREALIEGFLGSDPVYGKNICKIEKIYKHPDELLVFYYKLEPVQQSLAQYLNTFPQIHTKFLSTILIEIARILKRFNEKYAFKHNDLHTENIMLNIVGGRREYKFIDFGNSCITIGGMDYGSHTGCRAYDLLVLIADLYENGAAERGPEIFTPYCYAKLLASMGDGTGFNLYMNAGKTSMNRFEASSVLYNRYTNYDSFIQYWSTEDPTIQMPKEVVTGGRRKSKKRRMCRKRTRKVLAPAYA
jgi:serine/threonine protein kinase